MKQKFSFAILAICLLGFATSVNAQYRRFTKHKQYWSVGGTINAVNYFGDIAPAADFAGATDVSFTRPNFAGFVQKRLASFFTARATLSFGLMSSDDYTTAGSWNDASQKGRWARNQQFTNAFTEIAVSGVFDIFDNKGLYYKRPGIPIPYFHVGIGALYHNPTAPKPEMKEAGFATGPGGETVNASAYAAAVNGMPSAVPLLDPKYNAELDANYSNTISTSNFAMVIPFGMGVRYKLTPNLDIALELGYRFTFTDYLDGVGGVAVDRTQMTAEQLAMWDRSGEASAATSSGTRIAESPVDGSVDVGGTKLAYKQYSNGQKYMDGWAVPVAKEDGTYDGNFFKRGSDFYDAYLFTGISVNYIFSSGVKSPKYRRR